MVTTKNLHRGLADIRLHWVTAATYDVHCARKADSLLKRDRWISNIVLTATTISSLSIFTALVAETPDLWAKVVVFAITGSAAVLTAIRQQSRWAELSGTLRARGEVWDRLKSDLGDAAQQVIDGHPLSSTQIKSFDTRQADLLHQHPEVDTQELAQVRGEMEDRFAKNYE